jgi:hypothetical protein
MKPIDMKIKVYDYVTYYIFANYVLCADECNISNDDIESIREECKVFERLESHGMLPEQNEEKYKIKRNPKNKKNGSKE